MEDIRLGRKKFSRVVSYLCNAGGIAVIPADPKRVSVTISGNGVNSIFVSDKPISAIEPGLLICAAGTVRPEVLRVEDQGSFVNGSIFVSVAAAAVISVIETALTQE